MSDSKKDKSKKDNTLPLKRFGKQIVIPVGADLEAVVAQIQKVDYDSKTSERQDNTWVAVMHTIEAYPLEGAWALSQVLLKRYGTTELLQPFFGPPPTMLSIDVGDGKIVQVPWGEMRLKDIEGHLETGIKRMPDATFRFVLKGKVLRKYENVIKEIVLDIQGFLREKSLLRGKAIRVSYPDYQDEDDPFSVDPLYLPKVMDLSGVRPNELIFSRETERLITLSIFVPISRATECRARKIPLKRGVLLEGPYGTGKTLTAYVTAKLAVEHGWTFIYVDKAKNLAKAYGLATQYQPCVLFAEDIDTAMEGSDRTDFINRTLNSVDGVTSKDLEVLTILTTNRVDVITRAMLRPGRLDAVISVRAPDAEAAGRMIRLYARDQLAPNEDLTQVGEELKGMTPALLREVVERAKLYTLGNDNTQMRAEDLLLAAQTIKPQAALLEEDEEDELSETELAAAIIGDKLLEGLTLLAGKKPGNGVKALEAAVPHGTELPES